MAAQVYHAVGKRKSAVARVYIENGSGQVSINDRELVAYFPKQFHPTLFRAFQVLGLDGAKYDLKVTVAGGGVSAQVDAAMYGIARALTLISENYRTPLKRARLLTRDARVVERKKYGHKKARKSFQFSKR